MKKIPAKNIALLFVTLISLPVWSQPDFKDSVEVYNYWGKRGILEVVYSYMQDYVKSHPQDSAEKKGMDAYCENFIEGIDKKSTTDIDSNFKGLSNFLIENRWSSTAKKIVLPLKERYDKEQKLDSTFFSVFKLHDQDYIKTGGRIIDGYNKSIQKFNGEPAKDKTPQISNPNNPHEDLPEISTPDIKYISYLWEIIIFVLGLIIGSLLIYYYTKHEVFTILRSEKYEYEKILGEGNSKELIFKFIYIIKILKKRKDDYKLVSEKSTTTAGILNQKINDLTKKNDELLNENIELGQELEKLKNKGFPLPNEPIDHNNYKILYYSIPEIDGTFKTENAKDNREQDSFYKMELISNTHGNIYFLSGESDLRAIENIDYYLNPVCEVQNIVDRAIAKKVEMINPGSIVLKGDSWQVNNKLKIKLV